ncbi:hypothetical protein Y030_2643 [Burkholderia pseudomallei MSHR332]|nr:hypothetical protein Y030_2643 [Burkholderia pseudomallei MSHR332]
MTIAAPTPKPCARRAPISAPIEGASAHAAPATSCSSTANASVRRCPKRSAAAPQTSCDTASAAENAASVACALSMEPPSCCGNDGTAGR